MHYWFVGENMMHYWFVGENMKHLWFVGASLDYWGKDFLKHYRDGES